MLTYALVLAVGLIAGIVSGIVGTGATVILLPGLVFAFGPREAVPIMTVVALMSNFAKITAWWREIDWRACAAYALGGARTELRILAAYGSDGHGFVRRAGSASEWQPLVRAFLASLGGPVAPRAAPVTPRVQRQPPENRVQ